MKIPKIAYEAIERSLRDSMDKDLEAEAAAMGFPQPPESRAIIERLARLVGGAPAVDDENVELSLKFFTRDDTSCLLGVVTGLFLSHKALNAMLLENGELTDAMEVAVVGRAIGIAGGRILKAHKAAMQAAMN